MIKKRLLISFSGGRTSAFMLWWLMNKWEKRDEYDIIVVFANTGKEVEGTLFFVDECSQEWGIPIVWVEGYPSEKGKGWAVNHKVVNYETAARKGEPFEAMISKLGVPSTNAPFCSPQLKKAAIKSYAKSIGWKNYYVAIGLRWDEVSERADKKWKKKRILYPLIELTPTTKSQIIVWWQQQSFDLNIHPDDGNCDGCWKKDDARLCRIMTRKPSTFDWWDSMVKKYGHLDPRDSGLKPPFNFFRGNKSVEDIKKMASYSLSTYTQVPLDFSPCSESCEAF